MQDGAAVEAGCKSESLHALITACAVGLGAWSGAPWPAVLGLAVLGGLSLLRCFPLRGGGRPACRWGMALAWACSLVAPVHLLLFTDPNFTLYRYTQRYFALLAWVVASSVLLTGEGLLPSHSKVRWRAPGLACALSAVCMWLVSAYAQDVRAIFYLGLLMLLLVLGLFKLCFRLPSFWVQTVNTVILLAIGLPLADQLRPAPHLQAKPVVAKNYYSFNMAKRDPLAFARWWNFSVQQWNLMLKDIFEPDPAHRLPARMRPNTRSKMFESSIRINNRGFRGRDIPEDKGATYLIVAIGGSTTFGCTLGPTDEPWPLVLEQMIRKRLNLSRPVRVVNAGVPSYCLIDNLNRFATDILPLKPDMILCYDGYNGFNLLDSALPPVYGRRPPEYRERPLRLLADCEYRLKMMRFRARLRPPQAPHPLSLAKIMESDYAQAYRALIHIAKTNCIRLAISTFSMAVNSDSAPPVISFYRAGFPLVRWQIRANEAHTLLVNRLSQEHPEVTLVNTLPGLDGHHEDFIDLVHFTQTGRETLAETFFSGIRETLEKDLAPPGSTAVGGP